MRGYTPLIISGSSLTQTLHTLTIPDRHSGESGRPLRRILAERVSHINPGPARAEEQFAGQEIKIKKLLQFAVYSL